MNAFKRIFVLVADSVGCGSQEDSNEYGDAGANTLLHTIELNPKKKLPNLKKMGIDNILYTLPKPAKSIASYGKLREISKGKDTLTGHYEMMGLQVEHPFLTFTETGFPKELIDELEKRSGYKVICNRADSGIKVIEEYGERHCKTKELIVYTSTDSVLQIACHEKYFGLQELYKVCQIARDICMNPKWKVARIIARPFIGENRSNFSRTSNRHDYAISPFGRTTLNRLKDEHYNVIGVGKISDIFNGEGITQTMRTTGNKDGLETTLDLVKNYHRQGLFFINLVDFDTLYGHRRKPYGYMDALIEMDGYLKDIIKFLNEDDLLIVTADHGNDPTWSGTNHTREFTPLIVYSKNGKITDLGTRGTFADIGQTICDNFKLEKQEIGTSFLQDVLPEEEKK